MLDLGWSELLLIGIVALIVVGPKDLPKLFRSVGQYVGKARSLATEFQRAMNQAADESGVKDMARDLKSSVADKDMGLDAIRDLQKGPKAWARDAVRDKVLSDDELLADMATPPEGKPGGPQPIVRDRKAAGTTPAASDKPATGAADATPVPTPEPPVESSQYPPRPAAPKPAPDKPSDGKDGAA